MYYLKYRFKFQGLKSDVEKCNWLIYPFKHVLQRGDEEWKICAVTINKKISIHSTQKLSMAKKTTEKVAKL